jgi:hypothetical protein
MGAEKRAKAERRRQRQEGGHIEREMERQGVFRRHRIAECALQSSEFRRKWREVATLRDGTDREVEDLERAHALTLEILASMEVDVRDLTIKLQRRFNTVAFFCRPDSTRIRAESGAGAAAAA